MVLVERDAALGALAEYAEEARRGAARTVVVAGEAGVGKTALLEALREQVPDARWLWGACQGSFTPPPLAPVLDIAPVIGGDLAAAAALEEVPRERVFRALLADLTASSTLTVLCVEDAHWADKATLDLLLFLAPRLRESPVLLVMTYRDDGLAADHPLRVTIGELAAQRSTRRVDLGPLSREAVEALASSAGVGADDVFALTGGNPFLVTEVLALGTPGVPPSAREAVLARVARLSADARRALEAAAIIGTTVDADLLMQAASCSADVVDECLTAGALVSMATGFRFRHEIARLAVVDSLHAHRRSEIHQRVLALLSGRSGVDDARLAYHAEGAGDAAAVLEHATRAGREAARLAAHREAASQYERALRFADAASPRVRAELCNAYAHECGLIDNWHDAEVALRTALALWEELDDRVRVGDTHRLLSRAMWRLCRGDEAVVEANRAVDVLEALPATSELANAYANHATFCGDGGAESLQLLEKALSLAEEYDDRPLVSNVLNSLAVVRCNLGEDGIPDMRRALEIGLEIGDDEMVGRAYANLQAILGNQLRFAEAEAVYREGMEYSDVRDLSTFANCLRGGYLELADWLGRWDEVESLCAFDLNQRNLSPINKVGKLIILGKIRARRGVPDEVFDEALELAVDAGTSYYVVVTALALLEAAWLVGDAAGMVRERDRALAHLEGEADPWMRGAIAAWTRRCGLSPVDIAGIESPYAELVAGDWRAAADIWQEMGSPYERGLALLDSATYGSPDTDAMLEAVRIFDDLGASATVARAQAILRQCGVKSIPRGRRASTRANGFGLTRRELEVLALVKDGLTNGDIAARLFISEKTVDNHVSALLAKLGVGSRRDAARIAVDADLVAPSQS